MSANVTTRKDAPGPRGHGIWGSLPEFQQGFLQFYLGLQQRYGDISRFRMGVMPGYAYLLTHPDYIQYVLRDNQQNYRKGHIYRIRGFGTADLMDQGLTLSEGELWQRHRRLINPLFHRQKLASYTTTITNVTGAMLRRWQASADKGETLDIHHEMKQLSLAIVARTLFGTENTADLDALVQAWEAIDVELVYRVRNTYLIPEFIPTPRNYRLKHTRRTLHQAIDRFIKTQRCEHPDADGLISLLLGSPEQPTRPISDQELHDEVGTIVISAYDTTANALVWVWYLLSKYPGARRKLEAELARVLDGRTPTIEDLPQLSYIKMVIQEAIRLYPPIWAFTRQAIQDDEIGGYFIPARSLIILGTYVTHRHPSFWENPEGFEPERFAAERADHPHHVAYFPFGGGPRMCIGKDFALLEAQLVVAMVAQRFQLNLVPGQAVEPWPQITLAPRYGVRMTLHRIDEQASA